VNLLQSLGHHRNSSTEYTAPTSIDGRRRSFVGGTWAKAQLKVHTRSSRAFVFTSGGQQSLYFGYRTMALPIQNLLKYLSESLSRNFRIVHRLITLDSIRALPLYFLHIA